jgi:hypothetical protein
VNENAIYTEIIAAEPKAGGGEARYYLFKLPEGYSRGRLDYEDWWEKVLMDPAVDAFGPFKTQADAERFQRLIMAEHQHFVEWNPTGEKPQ